MPRVKIRLQNSTDKKLTFVSKSGTNVNWNQDPPKELEANKSSGNFQISYEEDADFDFKYKIEDQVTPFTASALLEKKQLYPAGAAPGAYSITFNEGGAFPDFTLLYTYNSPA